MHGFVLLLRLPHCVPRLLAIRETEKAFQSSELAVVATYRLYEIIRQRGVCFSKLFHLES
jgi:hypothetical protein